MTFPEVAALERVVVPLTVRFAPEAKTRVPPKDMVSEVGLNAVEPEIVAVRLVLIAPVKVVFPGMPLFQLPGVK